MQWLVIVLILVVLCLVGALIFLISRQAHSMSDAQAAQNIYNTLQNRIDALQNQLRLNLDGNTQLIQKQMGQLTEQMDQRLGKGAELSQEATKQVNERLDNAARFFADLQNRLGKLDEANARIFNLGKDISSLQEILRSPKARGSLGELLLGDLLSEMLPRDRFDLQYSFKSNDKVDAVIRVGGQMISVDSKFPLENFRRLVDLKDEDARKGFKKQFVTDVKRHIDAIARKYILPEEGTFDFAFMYIPAENVFYEVITRDDELGQEDSLQAYGLKKRVIPVSPNSFYAYLGALMYALRGERMQKNVYEILSQMRHLAVDLGKFRDDFEKIGFHLNNLKRSYEDSEKKLSRYHDRLEKIQEADGLEDSSTPVKLIS